VNELINIEIPMALRWQFGTGRHFSRFIQTLRNEGKILGIRCPQCQRVYIPPRLICGNCYREMAEWVDVKDTGVIQGYTVYYHPILDPVTGEPRPIPYGMALIKLDGADTTINHYLSETDLAKLRIGLKVRAVWRLQRRGFISDISHFEVIQ